MSRDVAQSMGYLPPSYMTTSVEEARDVACDRCHNVLGIDYGRRFEIVDAARVLCAVITSGFNGRCSYCYTFYKWFPSKRK